MAEDDDLAAAELALGLLDGEERAAALRRMMAEPEFTRAVEAWQERLAPLGDLVPAVSPSDGLWARIEAALGKQTGEIALLASVRRWKLAAAGATALAASLAMVLLMRPAPTPVPTAPAPALVAQLGPSDAKAVLLASYDQDKALLTIAPATITAAGHSAELWVIPEGDKPHSLGLVGESGLTKIVIPVKLRATMHSGATIAVSIEPIGGSPTGQPTGPVVAVGKFTKI